MYNKRTKRFVPRCGNFLDQARQHPKECGLKRLSEESLVWTFFQQNGVFHKMENFGFSFSRKDASGLQMN